MTVGQFFQIPYDGRVSIITVKVNRDVHGHRGHISRSQRERSRSWEGRATSTDTLHTLAISKFVRHVFWMKKPVVNIRKLLTEQVTGILTQELNHLLRSKLKESYAEMLILTLKALICLNGTRIVNREHHRASIQC